MQVAVTGKMASPLNTPFWLLSHKKERNQISDKGARYLSKAVWGNLKELQLGNIQQMQSKTN